MRLFNPEEMARLVEKLKAEGRMPTFEQISANSSWDQPRFDRSSSMRAPSAFWIRILLFGPPRVSLVLRISANLNQLFGTV